MLLFPIKKKTKKTNALEKGVNGSRSSYSYELKSRVVWTLQPWLAVSLRKGKLKINMKPVFAKKCMLVTDNEETESVESHDHPEWIQHCNKNKKNEKKIKGTS